MSIKIDSEFQDWFPRLSSAEELALVRGIKATKGNTDPVVVWKGKGILLDGHNRYRICERFGLPCATREVHCKDRAEARALAFSLQIGRRNLTPDQLIAFAIKAGVEVPAVVRSKGITVDHAHELAKHAPELFETVLRRERTIQGAYNQLALDRNAKATAATRARLKAGERKDRELAGGSLRGPERKTSGEVKVDVAAELRSLAEKIRQRCAAKQPIDLSALARRLLELADAV